MNRIDESKPFKPVNIAVLTVSDTRTLATDKSGDTLVERIARDGHMLVDRAIVTDDVEKIRAQVRKWIDDPRIEAVISTGGTGVTGCDVTPEALEGLFEKKIEGFGHCAWPGPTGRRQPGARRLRARGRSPRGRPVARPGRCLPPSRAGRPHAVPACGDRAARRPARRRADRRLHRRPCAPPARRA